MCSESETKQRQVTKEIRTVIYDQNNNINKELEIQNINKSFDAEKYNNWIKQHYRSSAAHEWAKINELENSIFEISEFEEQIKNNENSEESPRHLWDTVSRPIYELWELQKEKREQKEQRHFLKKIIS